MSAMNEGISRRRLMGGAALLAAPAILPWRVWADEPTVDLHSPSGNSLRHVSSAFPEKGPMIVHRTRPAWLEPRFETFDKGVFTPNDQHYVSWHYQTFPTEVDPAKFSLAVRGHVTKTLSLSIKELLAMPRIELAAVNQCAGNSRLYFEPGVAGAPWANGSMANAKWTGVPLRHVLDLAGIKPGAQCIRFAGMDDPPADDAPRFMKSLSIDHARDGEVMLAFGMNGEQLPLLNGFPLRLVVPGWVATYWIKALNDIEVLDQPDTNYWTTKGYRFPDVPDHAVEPGQTGYNLVSITKLFPRSFVTNLKDGDKVAVGKPAHLRGIAFGGDCGVAKVELSLDGGKSWQATRLGKDEGKYGFRRWESDLALPGATQHAVSVRCTNAKGEAQPLKTTWNPQGYMRFSVETIRLTAA
jgi:DMSO/TMAO reductase YedYZ molybdopterin-dependent catalytic subunit